MTVICLGCIGTPPPLCCCAQVNVDVRNKENVQPWTWGTQGKPHRKCLHANGLTPCWHVECISIPTQLLPGRNAWESILTESVHGSLEQEVCRNQTRGTPRKPQRKYLDANGPNTASVESMCEPVWWPYSWCLKLEVKVGACVGSPPWECCLEVDAAANPVTIATINCPIWILCKMLLLNIEFIPQALHRFNFQFNFTPWFASLWHRFSNWLSQYAKVSMQGRYPLHIEWHGKAT